MKKAFRKLVCQRAKQTERDALQAASSSTETSPPCSAATAEHAGYDVNPANAETGLDLLASEERGLAFATLEPGCAATSLPTRFSSRVATLALRKLCMQCLKAKALCRTNYLSYHSCEASGCRL